METLLADSQLLELITNGNKCPKSPSAEGFLPDILVSGCWLRPQTPNYIQLLETVQDPIFPLNISG